MLVRGFQRVKNVAINTLKKEYYLTNLEGVSYPLSRAIFRYKKTYTFAYSWTQFGPVKVLLSLVDCSLYVTGLFVLFSCRNRDSSLVPYTLVLGSVTK